LIFSGSPLKVETGDRYRHRLRGQLGEDAKHLEEYLRAEPAEVVTLPTGA
jgi:hypothetical protein